MTIEQHGFVIISVLLFPELPVFYRCVLYLVGSCYTEYYFAFYEPKVYTIGVNAYCSNIDGRLL